MLREFLWALVDPGSQASQVRRTQRCGFNHLRAQHWDAQQIGLELHQQIVHASAAIDPQLCHCLLCVAVHGLQQGGALKRDTFERCARNMRHGGAARQTDHGAARIGLPIRSA